MSKRGREERWATARILVVPVVMAIAGGALLAQSSSPGTVRRATSVQPAGIVSANVTLWHRRVRKDGAPAGVDAAPVTMRFNRRLENGRWRSTLVFHEAPRPTARIAATRVPLENPFVVARVDFDEDNGEAVAFDGRGRRVALPTEVDRRRLGLRPDTRVAGNGPPGTRPAKDISAPLRALETSGLVAAVGNRDRRRADLERAFGPPIGRVRGLDRFMSVEGDETREVLVDAQAALPVEVNRMTSAALRGRMELRYSVHPSIGHVRDFMRSEQVVDGTDGDRVITDIQVSNVTVTAGGRS